MWRQGKSTIGVSVGTNLPYRTALSQRKVLFTSAHFAMDLWTAMWRLGTSTIGVSVGTNFRCGTALSQRKVSFTSAHFAMDLWTATWRQGKSTIDLCATINFTSRTVKSASRHGVIRTVARSAPLLFGHRCHVAALLSRMTCHRENHVTRSSGTFPRKRQRKQKRNKSH